MEGAENNDQKNKTNGFNYHWSGHVSDSNKTGGLGTASLPIWFICALHMDSEYNTIEDTLKCA